MSLNESNRPKLDVMLEHAIKYWIKVIDRNCSLSELMKNIDDLIQLSFWEFLKLLASCTCAWIVLNIEKNFAKLKKWVMPHFWKIIKTTKDYYQCTFAFLTTISYHTEFSLLNEDSRLFWNLIICCTRLFNQIWYNLEF